MIEISKFLTYLVQRTKCGITIIRHQKCYLCGPQHFMILFHYIQYGCFGKWQFLVGCSLKSFLLRIYKCEDGHHHRTSLNISLYEKINISETDLVEPKRCKNNHWMVHFFLSVGNARWPLSQDNLT